MQQGDLFNITRFDGPSLEAIDVPRLERQLDKVRSLMADGKWRTLEEIQVACGGVSQAGVSARLRDLRKSKNGGYTVEKRRRGMSERGLWEYRMVS